MRTWKKALGVALMGVSVAAARAEAQSGNIQALATVLAPITITAGANLDFGNVTPGVAKTVLLTDATSGRFDATGEASANVQISFTLPVDLVGPANLPIGSWTGCWNNTASSSGAGCTAIANMAGNTAASFGAGGALWVFVGGTVTPAAGQAAGSYSANVTMTLSYL